MPGFFPSTIRDTAVTDTQRSLTCTSGILVFVKLRLGTLQGQHLHVRFEPAALRTGRPGWKGSLIKHVAREVGFVKQPTECHIHSHQERLRNKGTERNPGVKCCQRKLQDKTAERILQHSEGTSNIFWPIWHSVEGARGDFAGHPLPERRLSAVMPVAGRRRVLTADAPKAGSRNT